MQGTCPWSAFVSYLVMSPELSQVLIRPGKPPPPIFSAVVDLITHADILCPPHMSGVGYDISHVAEVCESVRRDSLKSDLSSVSNKAVWVESHFRKLTAAH